MAAPLKDRINPKVVAALGARFQTVAGIDVDDFTRRCAGLGALELKDRAALVGAGLAAVLPTGDAGLEAFIASLEEPLPVDGLAYFVHGALLLELQRDADFDLAIAANVALTERFTAEFSIRPLLDADPERGIAHLQALALSANVHHRRLVSEGSRPRLPWAPRLTSFAVADDAVDELLVGLSDDPEVYVRRSVANHIGDIAKDDLERALRLCRAIDHPWVKTHALRHPVKQGNAAALKVLGFAPVSVDVVGRVHPGVVQRGEPVTFEIEVRNRGADIMAVIDVVVDFAKKGGVPSAKTFKVKTGPLPAGATIKVRKTLATHDLSTRVHWPGVHPVRVQVNGARFPIGSFTLR